MTRPGTAGTWAVARESTINAGARLHEVKDRAWLGEVAALEESLRHLRQPRADTEVREAVSDRG